MIVISPTNPIRFKGSLDYEFSHNEFKCYLQKYNLDDVTTLQILSDEEEPPLMQVFSSADDTLLYTLGFHQVASNILVNEDFKVYELEILFSNLGIGEYYFKFNEEQYSPTVHVLENHEDTILLKYRNSYNKFGIIFDTDLVMYTRVEGTIQNYEPKSEDEIYNDQVMNATKLYSLPYNIFTLFVGGRRGIPDFMIDLVNRIFSCDMIKVDGYWFEKIEGAEWEMRRIDDYPFAGMSINVMPAINNVSEQIRIDEGQDLEPSETMIIQRYSNNYNDATGSLSVPNIFEKNSVLNYIKVYRKSTSYVMRVGTTPNGNEIAEVLIENILHTINLNHAFNENQTVYISGMVGANDISLVWDKVDRFFNPASGADPTPQPAAALGVGAVIEYHGSQSDLELDFNLVTGLGRDTGNFIGWAICNGSNGTPDMGGRVGVGWKRNDPKFGELGKPEGSETHTLSVNQLPRFRVKLFANETRTAQTSSDLVPDRAVIKGTTTSGSRDEKYSLLSVSNVATQATVGESSEVGGGQSHNIMQPYIVLVKIKKVY